MSAQDHLQPHQFNCRTCGGSYTVHAPANPADWTAEHIQAQADAVNEHKNSHPDELKVGAGTYRPKSDWAGRSMAARGENVPRRGRRR